MTLLYTAIILLTGLLVSYLLAKNMHFVERLSIGFGIGMLYYSLIYFLIMFSGRALNNYHIGFSIAITLILLIIFNIKNKYISADFKSLRNFNLTKLKIVLNRPAAKEKRILLIYLILLGFVITAVTLFWPISEWDALTLYDFRGRIYADGLTFKDVQKLDSLDTFNAGYYFSYPPSTSLLHASYYLLGSNQPQILYPIIYFSLGLFFYLYLSKRTSPGVSFLLTITLMSINIFVNHALVPYSNLAFTYFYFVSTILLVEYISMEQDTNSLFLSGLFLAGSSWMRSVEPFYIINLLAIFLFLILKKKNLVNLIIFAAPVLAIRKVWSLTQSHYATQSFLNNINYSGTATNFINLIFSVAPKAISALYGFLIQNLLIFSVFAIVVLYLLIKRLPKANVQVIWLVGIILSNFAVISVGTVVIGVLLPGRSEIYDSINRFGIFLYPLILFVTGLVINEITKEVASE